MLCYVQAHTSISQAFGSCKEPGGDKSCWSGRPYGLASLSINFNSTFQRDHLTKIYGLEVTSIIDVGH